MTADAELTLPTEPDAEKADWSLFIAGDCCLDRTENGTRTIVGSRLGRRIDDADCSVVNLEAPVPTEQATPIPKSGPALTTARKTPERIAASGFDVATLANNHMMDYGADGLDATLSACEQSGLRTVGAGGTHEAALSPTRFQVTPDTEVALFSVCEREFGVADSATAGTAWSDHDDVDEAIRQTARTADVVVVVAHGGVEYVPFSPPDRRLRLREFVDAGADFVVGHHPHVPQGWERYGDGAIFHSLGNFLFDRQSDGTTTGWGLTLDVQFEGSTPTAVELVPTEVVEGTAVELVESPSRDRAAHLDYLHRVAACTADDDRFPALWQSVAVRLFHERYWNWLQTDLDGDEVRAVDERSPLEKTERSDATGHETLLALLNVVRNESHRAVVTTALSVLTGEGTDHRTPAIENTATDLLSWTER